MNPKLWLKICLKRLAGLMGYKLSKYGELPPIDVRSSGNHPALLLYQSTTQPVLVDVPISKGRGLRTLPLDITSTHPFVLASKAGLSAQNSEQSIHHALKHYYTYVQPKTAAEWLGLAEHHHSRLHNEVPCGISMPWDTRTPTEWREARELFAQSESKAAGRNLSIENGWHFWGPVDEQKLLVEARRIHRLMASLEANGHHRHNGHDGDIRGIMLRVSNDEWCWQVAGGEHRAAALSALGFKTVPVRIIQVVDRKDVDIWPGVISGVFSREAALSVFDRILEGAIPYSVHQWSMTIVNRNTHSAPNTKPRSAAEEPAGAL
ncbi:hypothetical protein [Marinobacter litoralis]|uniref:hypothetical protein n=1 Tax=Marinobacter litoralis TaxID=187981 RepID=UPI0018ED2B15|nr:hypothetical protein [Marinobacter litoralis]MBJ6137697.1 hypothetical protein [Marinobacter litoralis]